jgi:hypothetical protein
MEVWIATSSGVFLGRPLPGKAAGSDVQVFVVLTHHDHVDVVWSLAADRALDAGIKLDWTQVDVLVEVEPNPEKNSFFQDSRSDRGMTDRTQENGVAACELADFVFRKDRTGP